MSYLNAPATKMMATNCVSCGRPLVDAKSVEIGMGPECRKGLEGNIEDSVREDANKYVFEAALAAQKGFAEKVLEIADKIDELGLPTLASKVRYRFKGLRNPNRKIDIVIEEVDGMLKVKTPYRRGRADEFVKAWRGIAGRRYRDGANYVPLSQKDKVLEILIDFFPNKVGIGPKGVFRVPKPEPKIEQAEMELPPVE